MADEVEQERDWRAAEAYRPLLCADAAAWAWEFARRARPSVTGADGGATDLCFAERGVGVDDGPLAIWRYEADPSVPVFSAIAADEGDGLGLDVRALPLPSLVVTSDVGDQHVLVADGPRRLRFAVTSGDVLQGPVRLGFTLPGPEISAASLPGVQALLALLDSGRLPARPGDGEGRARRWLRAIQALDARRAGASQRQIAALVFGEERAAEDWNGPSDYMRMRVHRLVRSAEKMAAGGYRAAFGLRASRQAAGRTLEVWRSAGLRRPAGAP